MPQPTLKEGEASFTLTPEFLRDIVAKHTFHNSAAAAVRELIQNAHDACIVRCALTGTDDGTIHIILDPIEKSITIQDNGIGMTVEDIRDYLTTVGRGKKGPSISEKYGIPERNAGRLKNVIGEFGFGFIASFIIADEIEIVTRSVRGGPGVRCTFSTKGIGYKWTELTESLPEGTTLTLKLNKEHSGVAIRARSNPLEGSLLNYETLDTIVKKYCSFLEFPICITLKGDPASSPSNKVAVPWQDSKNLRNSVKFFFENRLGKGKLGEILHVIPIKLSQARGDEITAEGVLVLEDAPGEKDDDMAGILEIFVKGMWVCDHQLQEKDGEPDFGSYLLPSWAAFLRGILITPDLRPLPGRDNIELQHESFDTVRAAMHRVIADAFLQLAQSNAQNFNKMLDRFGHMFRGGLYAEFQKAKRENRVLLEIESDLFRYVRFYRYGKKFMQGSPCTLNEYLNIAPTQPLDTHDNENRRVVYFVPRPIAADRQAEFRQLLASQSLDVIIPEDHTELGLLTIADEVFPDVLVKNVEHDLLRNYAGLLEGEQRAKWSIFLKYYERLAEVHKMKGAEVGSLAPDYMPVVILNIPDAGAKKPEGDDKQKPLQEVERERKLKGAFVGLPTKLAEIYTQTLLINSRNSSMKGLLEYKEFIGLGEIDKLLDQCLHECYHLALLAALDSLTPEMLRHHVEWQCGVIDEYVKTKIEQNKLEKQYRGLSDALAAEKDRAEKDKKKLDDEQANLLEYKRVFGTLDASQLRQVPIEPEERMAVVVFCNMIGATGSLIGMDFNDRGKVLKMFVDEAKKCIKPRSGFFDKFTGDGVLALFGLECNARTTGVFSPEDWHQACEHAWLFSRDLEHAIIQLNSSPFIHSVIERNQETVKEIRLRVGLHAGHVTFGNFGGTGTAVGPTVILAARLCSESEAFIKAERAILCTEEFRTRSGRSDLQEVPYEFKPRGFSGDRRYPVYRPV